MRLLLTALTVVSFESCYYEASQPLTPTHTAQVDTHLLGTWYAPGEDGIVRVLPFDNHSFVIAIDSKDDHDVLRAHVTELGRNRFLNVVDLQKEKSNYLFFRYEWAGDTLVVRGLKDVAPPPLAGPTTLRTWLSQRSDDTRIYDDAIRLVRK